MLVANHSSQEQSYSKVDPNIKHQLTTGSLSGLYTYSTTASQAFPIQTSDTIEYYSIKTQREIV